MTPEVAVVVTAALVLTVGELASGGPVECCVDTPAVDVGTVTVLLTVTVSVTVRCVSRSGGSVLWIPGPGVSRRTTDTGIEASPTCSPASRMTDQVSPAASTMAESASAHHIAPRAFLIRPNLPRGWLSTGKALWIQPRTRSDSGGPSLFRIGRRRACINARQVEHSAGASPGP